jgi:hypothetical protein
MCRFKPVQLFHIVCENSQDIPRPNHRGLWDLPKSTFQKVPFFFCARAGIGNRKRTLNGTLENVNWIPSEIPIGNSVAPVQAWRPQQNAPQRAIRETGPSEAPELFGQDFHIFWNSDSILKNLCSGYFGLLSMKSEIWVKQFMIILNGQLSSRSTDRDCQRIRRSRQSAFLWFSRALIRWMSRASQDRFRRYIVIERLPETFITCAAWNSHLMIHVHFNQSNLPP